MVAALGDVADAGPGKVISDDWNFAARHHVEYAQPGRDPLLRVGIAGKLNTRILHLQSRLVAEIAGIDDRATLGTDHEAGVTDRMARCRECLQARHDLLAVLEEDDAVAQRQQRVADRADVVTQRRIRLRRSSN